MQELIAYLLFFSLCLVKMAVTALEPRCCMTNFPNGSVSYTLSEAVPDNAICSWTQRGFVIVAEDGDMDKGYVIAQTENGYIMRQRYSDVVCKLESPESGVSKEINCTDCSSRIIKDPNDKTSALPIVLITTLVVLIFIVIIISLIVCCKIHRRRKRNKTTGNDTEMQPVNRPD